MKLRKCKIINCYAPALEGQHYCEAHKQYEAADRQREAERTRQHLDSLPKCPLYQTAEWQRLRKSVLTEHPYCQQCGGTIRLNVHHTVKHFCKPDLFFDKANLIVLCEQCHKRLHGKRIPGKTSATFAP